MELSNFDYCIIGILFISLLIGLCRGLMREFLGLVSWTLAGLAMVYLTPILSDKFFKNKTAMTEISLGLGIAIVVLIIMTFIIYFITNKVRTSPLNALDRILGLVFGLARGAILILAVYLCLDIVMPSVKDSLFDKKAGKSVEYIIASGDLVKETFPTFFEKVADAKGEADTKIKEKATETKEELQKKLNEPVSEMKKSIDKKAAEYSDKERNAMDKLVTSHTDD